MAFALQICTIWVGYDPTMIADKYGIVSSTKRCRTIYETQSFVGRATRVWEVTRRSTLSSRMPGSKTRAEHLKHIAGVRDVPEFVCGEDVSIDGQALCTGNIRGIKSGTMRVRRRIVTAGIGSHIAEFRTKRELISALRDVVLISVLNIFLYLHFTYFLFTH